MPPGVGVQVVHRIIHYCLPGLLVSFKGWSKRPCDFTKNITSRVTLWKLLDFTHITVVEASSRHVLFHDTVSYTLLAMLACHQVGTLSISFY